MSDKKRDVMIRKAQEKDIEKILDLLRQVNLVHHIGRPDLFEKTTKYDREELLGILGDSSRPVVVATDGDDQVLGYAFCEITESHSSLFVPHKTLYIDDLCVDETLRGRHIGRRLYSAVRDLARESGCHHITLNVWSCNPAAMAFYERIGLKPYKVGMEEVLD